jgi:hypothetical protein
LASVVAPNGNLKRDEKEIPPAQKYGIAEFFDAQQSVRSIQDHCVIPAHRIFKTISIIEIMAKALLTAEANKVVSQQPSIPRNDGGNHR